MFKRSDKRVNIRPGVSVLSVLKHLNYQPWYALAEYVDNAVQSYAINKAVLEAQEGKSYRLKVSINISNEHGGRITIRDNAAGISIDDFPRAFKTAEVPPDRTGLSEFGMGMKSASTWFAPRWEVRTSALGEKLERTVLFDIASIVRDSLEDLDIASRSARPGAHYTEVVLERPYKLPKGRTLGKIKDHLASIYRMFLRDGKLELTLNDESLSYEDPAILVAPSTKASNAKPVRWYKDIDIRLPDKKRIFGFAALRETGSTSGAGFALLRRRRLIQGSADEGYRPEYIFGKSNSYAYQRLFGELQFQAFDVSHTKDGFRWEDDEELFLTELRKVLDAAPVPLLQQARDYRSKPKAVDLLAAADAAVKRTASTIEKETAGALAAIADVIPVEEFPEAFRGKAATSRREVEFTLANTAWNVVVEASDDSTLKDWLEVFETAPTKKARRIGVRMALDHPFTQQFAGADSAELEPLLRCAAAFGIACTTARDAGAKKTNFVLIHLNELMRDVFAKP